MPKISASKEITTTKFVDEAGNTVNTEYAGRKFLHITHKTFYSSSARACRAMLGVVALIVTLGLAIISKEVRRLLTQSTQSFWVEKTPVEEKKTPNTPENKAPLKLAETPRQITPLPDAITSGYGEYIVFRNQEGRDKRDIQKDVFEKVYQIFNTYSPAKIINDCPQIEEAQETCANRYHLIRNEVKKIDEHLEIAFVPRTLYELIYIRKAINEDVKHNKVCPNLIPENHTKTNNETEKRTKCWHSIYFDHMGDNNDPRVKETAYRLNRVMIKALAPVSEGLSSEKLLELTREETTFLQDYYQKCTQRHEEYRKNKETGEVFWNVFNRCRGPAINFGYEIPGDNSPMGLRNLRTRRIFPP